MKQMKCLLLSIIFVFSAIGFFGCSGSEDNSSEVRYGYFELLGDPNFKSGIMLNSTGASNDSAGRFVADYMGKAEGEPYWSYAQHNCRLSTRNGKEFKDGDWYEYTDSQNDAAVSKHLRINPNAGEVALNVDTGKDYEEPRDSEEDPWVHMLLEQGFSKEVLVSDLQELILDFSFTITKCENNTPPEVYDRWLHSAQFQMFFVIESMSTDEINRGLWFGVPFFEDRWKELQEGFGNFDAATGMYIIRTPQAEYLEALPTVGERVDISIDLLPQLESALERAHDAGFMLNSTISDLYFVNMNVGWEIPGICDVGVTFHNISLQAKYKEGVNI